MLDDACGKMALAIAASAAILALAACGTAAVRSRALDPPSSGDAPIAAMLADQCSRAKVPAMAAALVSGEGLVKSAVAGFRKWGDATPAALGDLWHLGSDTKVMTAVLAATFVEDGSLSWSSTVSEVFPELAASFDPAARGITLTQLLSHRAGLDPNIDYGSLAALGSIRDQRLGAARRGLSKKPSSDPGARFEYSNLGYVIAGAMIERVGNGDWESLMRERVFEPLGMRSAGFGGLGTRGAVDQPWGHAKAGSAPRPDGADVDNPAVLGPAGTVHCSIEDWSKFIADQLKGARGEPALLKAESYKLIQSPAVPPSAAEPMGYGFGWAVVERDWAGGAALTHTGSNTFYLAVAWLAPARDFAVLVCANAGSGAEASADEVAGKIIASAPR